MKRFSRFRILTFVVILGLMVSACQPIVVQPELGASATDSGESQARLDSATVAKIESLIEDTMQEFQIPGCAISVVQDGQMAYAQGFGVAEIGSDEPVTAQSVFQLFSIGKTVVGTAMMQLVEQGKVDLDDPVMAYLPYFAMADDRYQAITLRQLLSHTAGMPDPEDIFADYSAPEYDDEALERYVRGLSDQSLLFDPGSDWAYSNIGVDVMGDVIAKVSGQSFEEYVAEHIFIPLGMDETTFLVKETDPELLTSPHVANETGQVFVSEVFPYTRIHAPSAGLSSNVEDMASYAMAHLNGGILDGTRILDVENQAELWTPVTEAKFPGNPDEDRYYGLGWHMGDYKGHHIIGHGGLDPGFNSFLVLIPEQATGYLLACNYNADTFPAIILRGPILDALLSIK